MPTSSTIIVGIKENAVVEAVKISKRKLFDGLEIKATPEYIIELSEFLFPTINSELIKFTGGTVIVVCCPLS